MRASHPVLALALLATTAAADNRDHAIDKLPATAGTSVTAFAPIQHVTPKKQSATGASGDVTLYSATVDLVLPQGHCYAVAAVAAKGAGLGIIAASGDSVASGSPDDPRIIYACKLPHDGKVSITMLAQKAGAIAYRVFQAPVEPNGAEAFRAGRDACIARAADEAVSCLHDCRDVACQKSCRSAKESTIRSCDEYDSAWRTAPPDGWGL